MASDSRICTKTGLALTTGPATAFRIARESYGPLAPPLFDNTWPTSHGTTEEPLTLSQITGGDRALTPAIAAELRENVTLDDATLPLGIRFVSKHGSPTGSTGLCWAYWMRGVDNGLEEMTQIVEGMPIREDDPDYLAAQRHCKIKAR
ncbi:hypothetical protein M4I32_12515 [Microbacterium sp. LRZ72]|uniref:hypothetical protein n=1 Tax=Microbacterium sp. LRZ72 TaxID=2942481 RepID=UPI0029A69758|nr:hypothetical protein [Microbacterium sp. LRZ72]MDX2377624.1 hypothetical protein [Microbacterium sp. LRZ72]